MNGALKLNLSQGMGSIPCGGVAQIYLLAKDARFGPINDHFE